MSKVFENYRKYKLHCLKKMLNIHNYKFSTATNIYILNLVIVFSHNNLFDNSFHCQVDRSNGSLQTAKTFNITWCIYISCINQHNTLSRIQILHSAIISWSIYKGYSIYRTLYKTQTSILKKTCHICDI